MRYLAAPVATVLGEALPVPEGVWSIASAEVLSPCVYVATTLGCTKLDAIVASVAMAASRARALSHLLEISSFFIATSSPLHSPAQAK
jgi:hypothetical protein